MPLLPEWRLDFWTMEGRSGGAGWSSPWAALAASPSAPVEVLEVLCVDSHPAVRAAVAGNPAAPAPTRALAALSVGAAA